MAKRSKRGGPSPVGSKGSSRDRSPHRVEGGAASPSGGPRRFASTLKPYLIVFTASACGLVIEILAGRILAPTIGVSLYTWTSIIGVVLAGVSVGNYIGGRVADRFPSPTTLGFILLAGGGTSLSVLPTIGVVSGAFEGLPVVARIVFLTTTLFFLPSLVLGMVTPVVIKLKLRDLSHTGNVVGSIYAVSTAGSIFGTFLTGFVLIQWIGTRQTLLGTAVLLVLMALALGNLWRAKVPSFASIALVVGVGSASYYSGALASDCVRESSYYCIRVDDGLKGGRPVKMLRLDRLLHSYTSPEDPTFLAYGYEEVLTDIATYLARENPRLRALFIGGGGYTMPRYLEATHPQSRLEVIEIDPEVTRVAFTHLGLAPDTRIVTYNEDARMAVPKLPRGEYDLVVGDAFHDLALPYHLTTQEFNEQVRALLKHRGVYAVNVIDRLRSGTFLKSYVHTLKQTFPHVRVIRDQAKWDSDDRKTYVVVAANRPLSRAALLSTTRPGRRQPVSHFMPEADMLSWLSSPGRILLTDDYAPVENLLGHVSLGWDNIKNAQSHYEAGLSLESQGRVQDAIEEFDAALRLDPDHAPAHYSRGNAHLRMGQTRQAIKHFDEAIRLDPKAWVFQDRATALTQLGHPERALEDVDAAIRLDPQAAQAHSQRALLHTALNRDAQAHEDFNKAVELGAQARVLRAEMEVLRSQR